MAEKVIGYTQDGLVLYTYNEIIEKLEAALKEIYGDDINLDSSTPDAELIRIFAEMLADEHDTVRSLDSSFNPDTCRGAAQDYRYGLNNIERKAGFYTSIPINFEVINAPQELAGLDGQSPEDGIAWGVTDGSNNYLLNSTETFPIGTYTRQCTCTQMAAINPPINSISKQITSVNNINIINISNNSATSIGAPDESAERFSARRQQSFVNEGLNCCDSITKELLELPTVAYAKAYEHDYANYPDSPDADGIPLNTIWVVVDGGSALEIATAIYTNISGTATKGAQSYTLISNSGQLLTFNYDYATVRNIYLKFELHKLYSTFNIVLDTFKQTICNNTQIDINAAIDSSTMNQIIRNAILENAETVEMGAVPLNIQLSKDGSEYVQFLPAEGKQVKYVLIPENISIEVTGG